jgi:hypothetical protein
MWSKKWCNSCTVTAYNPNSGTFLLSFDNKIHCQTFHLQAQKKYFEKNAQIYFVN